MIRYIIEVVILQKTFSNLFKTYFVKICLILSKSVFFCQNLFVFCQYLSFFVKICQILVNICQNLFLFVNMLSKSVFICLYLSNVCLYLSLFVCICFYLSLFVFILSRFVKFWLSCLQNLYKSKSPISRSPQPVNDN